MDRGGFLNREIIEHFGEYARFCYQTFGNKVKKWITFNEPTFVIQAGYGGISYQQAPGGFRPHGDWAQYIAGHHLLLSHSKAVEIYRTEFQSVQKGQIGIALGGHWCIPFSESEEDFDAARRELMFNTGWFAHPIFYKDGDYPIEMKERVWERSKLEGRVKSRLPEFSKEEIEKLKGSADFVGVNYYMGKLVRDRKPDEYGANENTSVSELDAGVVTSSDPTWISIDPPHGWIYHNPHFLRGVLNFYRTEYNNPTILITEVGCMDTKGEGLNDRTRIKHMRDHLIEVAQAINDGCKIVGYTHWTLMDNFEWASGYSLRFGLYHVDFEDPARKRTPKASSEFYKKVIAERSVEDSNN
uniref:Beta-glucosidase n=1 Tax=Acrobeloides nanus TaxID=290746 RepID=A0A914DI18_9BILA